MSLEHAVKIHTPADVARQLDELYDRLIRYGLIAEEPAGIRTTAQALWAWLKGGRDWE